MYLVGIQHTIYKMWIACVRLLVCPVFAPANDYVPQLDLITAG